MAVVEYVSLCLRLLIDIWLLHLFLSLFELIIQPHREFLKIGLEVEAAMLN